MNPLFHPLLHLIIAATDHALARWVLYLKEENRILRDRVPGKQIHTTPAERARLLKYGKPIGSAIDQLIAIVKPSTFRRWIREEGKCAGKKGRPRTRRNLRELVVRIARETGLGYTRILGELRKLGIRRISRQTVKNICIEEGIEPSPRRSTGCWDEFLTSHVETLWACDFFTKRVATIRGYVELYFLVFMHVDSREIIVTSSTAHPNARWVEQQARNFLMLTEDRDAKPAYLIRDGDSKYTQKFDKILDSSGCKPKKLPYRSPNLNAHVERVGQTLKNECLRRFVVFGRDHLDYLLREFADYYNSARAHSARDNLPPCRDGDPPEWDILSIDSAKVVCEERLGGVVKSFVRRAA